MAETAAEVRPVPLEGLTARRRVAIVPALNEEACIGRVVEEIRAFDSGFEIVVVDDGSGDRTADVARAHGARVIRLPFNLGIGGAVQTGFRYAWENGFAWTVSRLVRQRVTDTTSGFQALNRRGIQLFATDYPHDYPEVEATVMVHRHRLRLREVPVRMRERAGGRSSITAFRSVYYMAKVLLALLVGIFRRNVVPLEDR